MRRAWPAFASIAGGGLLFLSDYPVHAIPLQLVAFVPLWIALARGVTTRRGAALCGLGFGLAYVGPFQIVLHFPILMAVGLVLALSALWAIVGVLAFATLRWPAP